MKITSTAFESEQSIPKKYTCVGENINPELEINDAPDRAKSLVLIVDDPDAPEGTFVHWIMWNIDPATTKIEENSVPKGAIQGINDFGKEEYGGPCPPEKIHHYRFKLYALDILLNLSTSVKKDDIEKAMENHNLDWAQLIGTYKK